MQAQDVYDAIAREARKRLEEGKQLRLVRLGHAQCLALGARIAPDDTIVVETYRDASASEPVRLMLPVERTSQHDYFQLVAVNA